MIISSVLSKRNLLFSSWDYLELFNFYKLINNSSYLHILHHGTITILKSYCQDFQFQVPDLWQFVTGPAWVQIPMVWYNIQWYKYEGRGMGEEVANDKKKRRWWRRRGGSREALNKGWEQWAGSRGNGQQDRS